MGVLVTVASLLVGCAVGFYTDVSRRDDQVTRRRLIWLIAAIAWCAIILTATDGQGELENSLLAYASGTFVGLLSREYHRAGPR